MTIYTIAIGAGPVHININSDISAVPWLDLGDLAVAIEGDIETGASNTRRIGHAQLLEAIQATGLADLFFGAQGLIPTLPCMTPLTPAHLETVGKALADWKAAHPSARPRMTATFTVDYVGAIGASPEDAYLGLLTWLNFWIGWALESCTHPTLMAR